MPKIRVESKALGEGGNANNTRASLAWRRRPTQQTVQRHQRLEGLQPHHLAIINTCVDNWKFKTWCSPDRSRCWLGQVFGRFLSQRHAKSIEIRGAIARSSPSSCTFPEVYLLTIRQIQQIWVSFAYRLLVAASCFALPKPKTRTLQTPNTFSSQFFFLAVHVCTSFPAQNGHSAVAAEKPAVSAQV